MKLIMLGTGTLHPEADRASAGLAVICDESWYQFDLGRGVVQRMAQQGLDPLQLQFLHFSHLHPDHSCDLVPLLFALNYAAEPPRSEPLHLTAPEGFHAFYGHLRRAWRWIVPEFPLHVREAEAGRFAEGPAELQTEFLAHGSMANLGYRIEHQGKALAYTGDTGPNDGLLSLAKGADILVSECSLPDAKALASHMSPTRLGQAASAADVGTLVVTHVLPGTSQEEIREAIARNFGGEIVMAEDGLTLEF